VTGFNKSSLLDSHACLVHVAGASIPSNALNDEASLLSPPNKATEASTGDTNETPAEDKLTTAELFRQNFRRYTTRNLVIVTIVAVAQIIIAGLNMNNRWSTPPSWMTRIPCPFQPAFSEFTNLILVSLRFLEFLNIITAIGAVFLGVYFLASRWKKSLEQWRPPHVGCLAIIFSFKILLALLLFTIVNYKLPSYTPYDVLAQTSCEMTISTIFFPVNVDGQAPDFFAGINNILRDAAEQYFANPSNVAGGWGFEGILRNLSKDVNTSSLSSSSCPPSIFDRENEEIQRALAEVVNPGPAIKQYCAAGLKAGKEGNNSVEFGWKPTEFPVQILIEYLLDLTNGISLSYYGCSGNIRKLEFPINKNLTFTQVCRDFYSPNAHSSEATDAYFGSRASDLRLRSRIRDLQSKDGFHDWYREAACMFIGNLGDPQTGHYAKNSVLCPAMLKEGAPSQRRKLVYSSVAMGPHPTGFDNHWEDAAWRELSFALYQMLGYRQKADLTVHSNSSFDYCYDEYSHSPTGEETTEASSSSAMNMSGFDDYYLDTISEGVEIEYYDNTSIFTTPDERARLFRWVVDEPQEIAQVHTKYMQYHTQQMLKSIPNSNAVLPSPPSPFLSLFVLFLICLRYR